MDGNSEMDCTETGLDGILRQYDRTSNQIDRTETELDGILRQYNRTSSGGNWDS